MTGNPYLPQKSLIREIKPQTKVDYTFILDCDMLPQSGQFVEVSLPGVGECPISISDFGPGWLEMTIRRVGRVTSVLHTLRPGDALFIRGPYGNGFPLGKYRGRHLVVAAGGTGLAPVKSVLNHFQRHPGELKSLRLLAGFKTPADILFAADMEKWGNSFDVTVTVDRGDDNWRGNTGLITEFVPKIQLVEPAHTEVIVVGPPLMMKFTVAEFIKLGVPEQNITVSFERKMCCGIGKCGHCKIDDTYVCLEGPVFNLSKAKNLID